MPEKFNKKTLGAKPRGVSNRLAGLQWIADFGDPNGVIFFLDDDNTFDIRLFDEIRKTKQVSMFPVGLIGSYALSSPVVKVSLLTYVVRVQVYTVHA